jgi:type IV pilus assembly protein PilQ
MLKGICYILLTLTINNAWSQKILSVNFLQEGEISKFIIETDKPIFAERKHIVEDKQIILDVKGEVNEEKILRGIDTSEFNGSAVYISGYKKPGSPKDTRFAIQLRDNIRSLLDLKDNKIVLTLENRFGVFSKAKIDQSQENTKSQIADQILGDKKINIPKSNSIEDILENLTLSGVKKYVGKKISLNVRNLSVVELLNMIAETSGFNIILDKTVDPQKTLTLNLTNIPWDQALDTILSLTKLVADKQANILTIKSLDQARLEQEEAMKEKQVNVALEPLVTKVFPISYAELPSLEAILKDYQTLNRGAIRSDLRTKSLIVKDTVDVIEKMKKIIEILDTQTPQILIESKIVEAQESYASKIGLERGVRFGYDPFIGGASGNPTGGFSFSSAPTGDSPGIMSGNIQVFKSMSNINFNLQLMESESKVKVVSSPKVITQNNKQAKITSTQQTSFIVSTVTQGVTQNSFQNISADVDLTVTPQVTNEGAINLLINLTKSGFGTTPSPGAPPNITRRNVTTTVLVENGSTVVLGGLYQTEETEGHSGIPFLKDLPLLGWLFRTPYNPIKNRSELMIFITPRIINQDEAGLVDREDLSTQG